MSTANVSAHVDPRILPILAHRLGELQNSGRFEQCVIVHPGETLDVALSRTVCRIHGCAVPFICAWGGTRSSF